MRSKDQVKLGLALGATLAAAPWVTVLAQQGPQAYPPPPPGFMPPPGPMMHPPMGPGPMPPGAGAAGQSRMGATAGASASGSGGGAVTGPTIGEPPTGPEMRMPSQTFMPPGGQPAATGAGAQGAVGGEVSAGGQAGGQAAAGMQMGGAAGASGGGQGVPPASGMPAPQSASTSDQPSAGGGPVVTVKEQPANVVVATPQPKVIVEQPAPQVLVEQPRPEVSVQTSQPQVRVQEASPNVSVQEPGQPQVQVNQTGQPTVTYKEPPTGSTAAGSPPAPSEAQASESGSGSNPLLNRKVSELKGKNVVNRGGDDLGEVEGIVIDRQSGQPNALLSVGGFLGIGDKTVAVPLGDMSLDGDRLVVARAGDQETLTRLPSYDPARYTGLREDLSIAQQMTSSQR